MRLKREEKIYTFSNKRKCAAGSVLFGVGFLLMYVSRISRTFAQWYSTHIYPVWVNTTGRLMGLFPFSVSEVLLYVLLCIAAISIFKIIVRRVRKCGERGEIFSWFGRAYVIAGALFFLFVINCGINYHRASFLESSGMRIKDYSAEELKSVCLWLTEEVNIRSGGGKRRDIKKADAKETNQEAVTAMKRLGKSYPELSGYYPNPKGLLFPWILSVQQLTGIYSPFTVEANYNSGIVDYNIPFTACHELSHLRGFMQEEEANFIAFLASSGSEDIYFQYSGYLMGWKYCMNALYKADYKAWEEVRQQLSKEVEPDLEANREFWDKYDGQIAETANKVNDTYLKANAQAEGVESYNKMVDLIVAYKAGAHSF